MADYFDTAGQQNDQAKAALLQAIATQGSNAKAAFDQQQAQIAQAKQAAIAQALAGAQQRGAPDAMQTEISNTISTPYDERSQTLGANSATRQAQIASIGASGDSYITKANAALPALRTRVAESTAAKQATVAQQVAAAQAAAIQRQQQAQMAAEEHAARMAQIQLENQLAQTRASAAQAKQKAAPGVNDILSKVFGGASGLNAFIDSNKGAVRDQKQQADNAERSSLGSLARGGSRPAAADLNIFGQNHPPLEDGDIAEQIGQAGGLPPGVASSLYSAYQQQQGPKLQKQQAADNPDLASIGRTVGLSVQGVQAMINSPEYKQAQQLAETYVETGKTLDELKVALGQASELKNKPKTRAAILAVYKGQLVSPSFIP